MPLVALLVVVAVLVFVLGNERQANTQFEQAHDALVQTQEPDCGRASPAHRGPPGSPVSQGADDASESALSSDTALLQSV